MLILIRDHFPSTYSLNLIICNLIYFQYSGKQLEFCTALFAHTVETVLIKYGGQIHHEHAVTQRIAKIAIHLYAMTAVLSRASRSYCIGLRNTDSEVSNMLCFLRSYLKLNSKILIFFKQSQFSSTQ